MVNFKADLFPPAPSAGAGRGATFGGPLAVPIGAVAGMDFKRRGGPNVVDVGTDSTQTGSIGGGGGGQLPTLDALLARQKELRGGGVEMGEMISPWQGISYAAQKGLEGFQEGANERDILAQEMQRAEILRSVGDGGITMEHVAAMSQVDPQFAAEMYKTVTDEGGEQWDPIERPQGESGQWFRNRKTGETKKVGGGSEATGPKESDITAWRGQLMGDESYTTASAASSIYGSMFASAGLDDRTSDLDMVSGLAKMIDPTGVVRGEDVAMIVANQPGMEIWKNYLETWKEDPKARLGPEIRKDIMRLAHSRASGALQAYNFRANEFRQMAARRGANPDDVVPRFAEIKPWAPEEKKPPKIVED